MSNEYNCSISTSLITCTKVDTREVYSVKLNNILNSVYGWQKYNFT